MNIGLMGFGNVGKHFYRLIQDTILLEREAFSGKIKFILDSTGGICASSGQEILLSPVELEKLKANPEYTTGLTVEKALRLSPIDLLVDLTSASLTDASLCYQTISTILSQKIHVVTGNKIPIAYHYKELREIASNNGVRLGIGCTAGGALPSINIGVYGLTGGNIHAIEGVLNGTSNYILWEMAENRLSFNTALKKAQDLGIAETNPEADVSGKDTAVKMLIIANILMDANLKMEDVSITGIEKITPQDIKTAAKEEKKIKLIGRAAKNTTGQVTLSVAPKVITKENPLYYVDGKDKGIIYRTDLLGEIFLSGGASCPAAAAMAVFRDILNISRGYMY